MIDPKTPMLPPDPKDELSDELFDPDFLGDADSEFFGELDRVLTTEDSEAGQEPQSVDIVEALEPFEHELETARKCGPETRYGEGHRTGFGEDPATSTRRPHRNAATAVEGWGFVHDRPRLFEQKFVLLSSLQLVADSQHAACVKRSAHQIAAESREAAVYGVRRLQVRADAALFLRRR